MNRKHFVSLLAGIALCSLPSVQADDYQITLRLSHVFSPDEQLTKSMDDVAERIRERTEGVVDIQTFPQAQLPTYKDGVEMVVRGAEFISVEDPSFLGDYVPDFKMLYGPMLYQSYDEYVELTQTALVDDLKKKAEEQGIKVLALDYIYGFRNVITDKTIVTPQDLDGVKLRTPGSKLYIDTLSAMGATAVPLPWGETLSAAQQGVVDGLEGSEFTNIGTKVYEVKKKVALTKHILGTCGVYLSTRVWDEMPEKYQQIVAEEFRSGAERMVGIMKDQHSGVVSQLEGFGVEFNEVDHAAFNEAVAPLFTSMSGVSDGMYDSVQAELAKIRQ
ncbi:C4-dicarboxylate TRAP transporter substrate-binding protein [Gammaproteobacteria bacterium]|nr:C4-dicarboxylate TRAP transporter substrate-binding protein [Gammaproteobacteria bacterium]